MIHMTHAPYMHMDMQPPHKHYPSPPQPTTPPPPPRPTCLAVMQCDCLLQYVVHCSEHKPCNPRPPLQPTNLLPGSHAFWKTTWLFAAVHGVVPVVFVHCSERQLLLKGVTTGHLSGERTSSLPLGNPILLLLLLLLLLLWLMCLKGAHLAPSQVCAYPPYLKRTSLVLSLFLMLLLLFLLSLSLLLLLLLLLLVLLYCCCCCCCCCC